MTDMMPPGLIAQIIRKHDGIVVRPPAWTIVLCGTTEFGRDHSAYRLGIGAVCKRDHRFVYMMGGIGGHVV